MNRMLNDAALALMVSVGHRTGLFDVMAAMPRRQVKRSRRVPRSTSGAVREWLAAMTTGRIVECDVADLCVRAMGSTSSPLSTRCTTRRGPT